jgi:catechol 2,3-dioxygenase-like lactoylglutathione lyase family enzyme
MTTTASNIAPSGIHHVTMIAGDVQRNVDFYAGVLGMRLVKRTVNFDDPGTYHLYYGDETGSPGTLLTFFPWSGARGGREGAGQFASVSLAIPSASLGFWLQRLVTQGVEHDALTTRFGERLIGLRDPDGLRVELVGSDDAARLDGWSDGPVPAEHAIRGVHAMTLWTADLDATAQLLEGPFAMRRAAVEGRTTRFVPAEPAASGIGTALDVRDVAGFWDAASGVGTVHHVAWRVPDDATEVALLERVRASGLGTTGVVDRKYFHSVYFREPGGSLFEIATDAPGFAIDEPIATLGSSLVLPPWLEPERDRISAALPSIVLPSERPTPFATAS